MRYSDTADSPDRKKPPFGPLNPAEFSLLGVPGKHPLTIPT
jgi:hypothetical protein